MTTNIIYRDGVATITTPTRKTEINVALTARLAIAGDLGRPSATDTKALAAGYEALSAEHKALHAELAAARAGTIGKEHAEAMQGARKVLAELRQAGEQFFAVYDQGDAPDSGLDNAFRDKLGEAENWLIADSTAATARVKLLRGTQG